MEYTPKTYFTSWVTEPMMTQLRKLTCLLHDTDIDDFKSRDELLEIGCIARTDEGWNYITEHGLSALYGFGFIAIPDPARKVPTKGNHNHL